MAVPAIVPVRRIAFGALTGVFPRNTDNMGALGSLATHKLEAHRGKAALLNP